MLEWSWGGPNQPTTFPLAKSTQRPLFYRNSHVGKTPVIY